MTFRERLRAGEETLVGTFIKTPHPHVIEVLSRTALDCLVLDAEHAPFGRESLDLCILAARAGHKPVLVRPPSAAPEHILNALDCGATGVLLPHIRTAAEAALAGRAVRYRPGTRGFAGSTRAAGYTTTPMAQHIQSSDQDVTVIAQIEDREALDNLDGILSCPDLDAVFVGRADLTLSLGESDPDAPAVVAAVEKVCAAGRAHGRTVGMFFSRPTDAPLWISRGARFFILSSDQAFMMAGANALAKQVKPPQP
jgi:2-keto-3-deoxy-L-rhamnonate aldolase RhmA